MYLLTLGVGGMQPEEYLSPIMYRHTDGYAFDLSKQLTSRPLIHASRACAEWPDIPLYLQYTMSLLADYWHDR